MSEDVIGTRTYGGLFADSERPVPTATMPGAGATARQVAREKVNATGGRLRCLKALEAAPEGLTRSQLATATEMPINTVNARTRELTDPKAHAPNPTPCYTEGTRSSWVERQPGQPNAGQRLVVESIVHARTL